MKFFVSYARVDSDFVLSLSEKLRAHNVDLWVDKLDLNAGKPWDDSIESALAECRGMLLVLSPASVASKNVKDEVAYAFDEGMTVVPVLYQPCKIPFRIRRLQYIDLTRGLDEGMPGLLRNLATESATDLQTGNEPEDVTILHQTRSETLPTTSLRVSLSRRTLLIIFLSIAFIVATLFYWRGTDRGSTTSEQVDETDATVLGATESGQGWGSGYSATTLSGDFANSEILPRFIEEFAAQYDVEITYLYGIFSAVKSKRRIHDSWESRLGNVTWARYKDIFVNPTRIARGKSFMSQHVDTMIRAEQVFGVPREYMAAIIGVETNWGEHLGNFHILDSLVNSLHSAGSSRIDFFLGIIEEYLLFAKSEGIDPLKSVGSYAGAMGYAQFLPNIQRQYGVDFDSDGKKDPWNVTDSIGSIGNFLRHEGWKRGQPVMTLATKDPTSAQVMPQAGLEMHYTLSALGELGIKPALTDVLRGVSDQVYLIPLKFDDDKAELWLGFRNFKVLTRLNASSYYAAVVHLLAQEIKPD